jgi:hypothetical protein
MTGHYVDPFHHDPILFSHLPFYPPGFALILTGQDQNSVTGAYSHYTTSGARDMIRMNP